jgi:hypothetical protein
VGCTLKLTILHLGGRTKSDAFAVAHDRKLLAQELTNADVMPVEIAHAKLVDSIRLTLRP